MVTINHLYEIELSCSNTLPTIDGTTTVTVTARDFNNNPLPNKSLSISVDKGYFTEVRQYPSSMDGYTNITQTITATVNSSEIVISVTGNVASYENQTLCIELKLSDGTPYDFYINGGTGITIPKSAQINGKTVSGINYVSLTPYFDSTNSTYYKGDYLQGDGTLTTSNFTHKSGSTISVPLTTTPSSFTGRTGDDGSFTLTYKATNWGLCTFSCDTKKIQAYVTGFKTLSVTSAQGNSCTFKVDESQRACWLQWTMPSTSLTSSTKTVDTITLPDEKYKSNYPVYTESFRSDTSIYLNVNGTISARLYTGTSTHGSGVMTFFWTYGVYD